MKTKNKEHSKKTNDENLNLKNKNDLLIRALKGRAAVYSFTGKIKEALMDIEKALMISKELNDRREQSDLSVQLSGVYKAISKYKEMLKMAEESFFIYKQIHDKKGIGNSLHNISTVYYYLGKYQKALQHFKKSL